MEKAFIIGEKVYLRPLERKDLEGDYRNWINDPEVTRHIDSGAFPVNDDQLLDYFERNTKDRSTVFFAIVDKENEKHIGNAKLYLIDWVNRKSHRGIMIGDTSYWGKGVGLEVINLISKYAFETLNLNRVAAGSYPGNIGIIKVNERAGYKIEGTIRQAVYRDGSYQDVISWSILKEDYMALKK